MTEKQEQHYGRHTVITVDCDIISDYWQNAYMFNSNLTIVLNITALKQNVEYSSRKLNIVYRNTVLHTATKVTQHTYSYLTGLIQNKAGFPPGFFRCPLFTSLCTMMFGTSPRNPNIIVACSENCLLIAIIFSSGIFYKINLQVRGHIIISQRNIETQWKRYRL